MVGYSPAEVFRTLDDVDMRAYAGLVLASGGYYVQYIANVRKGFRDRIHATPVPANMWNFADDIIYLALVGRWFGIRFSLGDLFPRLARREALVLYVGLQASLITLMAFFIQLVDDRILVLAITTTQVSSILFCIPMLLSRGHRRGISTASARAMLVAPPAFLSLFLPAVAPAFDTPATYALAAACFAMAVAYNLLLTRFPAEPDDIAPDASHRRAQDGGPLRQTAGDP